MPEPLTDVERDVLDFLIEYLRHNTYQPSVREIGSRLGIASTRRVSEVLGSLAAKGWIERTPSRSRGVRVLGLARDGSGTRDDAIAAFDPALPEDEPWMRRALALASAASNAGEVPVGAVLVLDGLVLAEAHNRIREHSDPTAHAEMIVLREAAARAGAERLPGATLHVTLEPCAMCAGAIVLARIGRLVYGARDPKTGMCGSLGCLVQDRRLNHRVRMTRDVLAAEAGELLRTFFRARR